MRKLGACGMGCWSSHVPRGVRGKCTLLSWTDLWVINLVQSDVIWSFLDCCTVKHQHNNRSGMIYGLVLLLQVRPLR